LFQKKLLLDSVKLYQPEFEVTHWRNDTTVKISKNDLSVSQEMGKLYNSILDGLESFGVRRIKIENAKLSIINKTELYAQPVTISNIYLEVTRAVGGNTKKDEFAKDEQSVDLRTTNQNIILPGGRHQLAFKTFNLQLFQKRIELDSCFVTAMPTDSFKSSYTIFFKKLSLIGVDFDAMYRLNLIRADSVYCERPMFEINLYASDIISKGKEKPDPEKIVSALTADLDLAFIGVKNAGIHIKIKGKKERSLFNSNKDDFEMHGLHINGDSSQPVVVDRFDMLVRDYRLYNEDSSAAYTFDSIHFRNNKIALNNFSVTTISNPAKIRSQRDFKIPYFELTGIDWYQIIFEENLDAQEAVLYHPTIYYAKKTSPDYRKKTDFSSLMRSLDTLVALNRLKIIDGAIKMDLGKGISFNFEKVNLKLSGKRLFNERSKDGLSDRLETFSFSKGSIQGKDISVRLRNARRSSVHLLEAEGLLISSRTNKIKASFTNAYINDILLNESKELIVLDGLGWRKAQISLQNPSPSLKGKSDTHFSLQNVSANNTLFKFSEGAATLSTFLQSVQLAKLFKNAEGNVETEDLSLTGNDLVYKNASVNVNASSYKIFSERPSQISKLKFEQIKNDDSVFISAPETYFTADLNLLPKKIKISSLETQSPVVKITRASLPSQQTTESKTIIDIEKIQAREPDIKLSIHHGDTATFIFIPKSENSIIIGSGLNIIGSDVTVQNLSIKTTSATIQKDTGSIIGVENGAVGIDLSNIKMSQKEGKPFWSATVTNLSMENPNPFAFSKTGNIKVKQASAGNINLSSDYLSNFNRLLQFNLTAWLRTGNGQYIDSTTTINWYNAEFKPDKKTLSLDSFTYHPTQSRDSVMAHTPYQTDYITFHSGAVQIAGFNLDKFKEDSMFVAGTINIDNPVVTVYRDKLPPFLTGAIKPLPVDLLRKIKMPVLVQKINLNEGMVSYTERNSKTREEGTFLLTHLNAELSNIKNRNIEPGDSLLWILNAYVMDSALVNLKINESYVDPLSGFVMSMQMKPTTLSLFNPVLAPLSNIIITSGTIDSLSLHAIGKEDVSIGEMKMYYHDLRIKQIKQGDKNQSSFGSKIFTWIANSFIIKKNNNGRTGIVYFVRQRDRSFFNYIVKMTFSGMATSIGVKSNRRFLKQYTRASH
jgi:hypothetical protein